MRWNRIMAAVVTVGAAAPACIATTALAAPASHVGTFKSWHAAQEAAGFKLIRPTRTFGLPRNGEIVVTRCVIKKKTAARLVTVSYGLTPHKALNLSQNDSGGPCRKTGTTTSLGTVRIHGTLAKLTGLCGRTGLPPCTSTKIFLFLTWAKHGIYYVASSFGERRMMLVGFARGTVPVR